MTLHRANPQTFLNKANTAKYDNRSSILIYKRDINNITCDEQIERSTYTDCISSSYDRLADYLSEQLQIKVLMSDLY